MISYLNGTIAFKGNNRIIIDVGGIGFTVTMPSIDIASLPMEGSKAKVFTYMHVREDAMELYGFTDKNGIEYFNKLISVNGVGAKAAIAILSVLSPSDLAYAIISEDFKAITRAQGVGAKIAQRIILELKGKIDTKDAVGSGAKESNTPSFAPSTDVSAINALIALGCSPSEAQKTVMQIPKEGLSTEDIIKEALRRMSNGI